MSLNEFLYFRRIEFSSLAEYSLKTVLLKRAFVSRRYAFDVRQSLGSRAFLSSGERLFPLVRRMFVAGSVCLEISLSPRNSSVFNRNAVMSRIDHPIVLISNDDDHKQRRTLRYERSTIRWPTFRSDFILVVKRSDEPCIANV